MKILILFLAALFISCSGQKRKNLSIKTAVCSFSLLLPLEMDSCKKEYYADNTMLYHKYLCDSANLNNIEIFIEKTKFNNSEFSLNNQVEHQLIINNIKNNKNVNIDSVIIHGYSFRKIDYYGLNSIILFYINNAIVKIFISGKKSKQLGHLILTSLRIGDVLN